MSQPKNRRRRARRDARAAKPKGSGFYMVVTTTGETRNPIGKLARLDMMICVGFGSARVYRDKVVYENGDCPKRRSLKDRHGAVTFRQVERHIKRTRQGHRSWGVVIEAPLWSAVWKRKRPGKWVCVAAGMGFA